MLLWEVGLPGLCSQGLLAAGGEAAVEGLGAICVSWGAERFVVVLLEQSGGLLLR